MDASHPTTASATSLVAPTSPPGLLVKSPSFTLSEAFYTDDLCSVALPSLAGLDLKGDPEKWVTTIKLYVKSAVYTFVKLNRRIMAEYKKCGATHYRSYQFIKAKTKAFWESWKAFAACKDITENAILESPLYYNFTKHILNVRTPKFSDAEETFRAFRTEGTQILATMRHGRSFVEQHISSLNDGHIRDKGVVSPAVQPVLHKGKRYVLSGNYQHELWSYLRI